MKKFAKMSLVAALAVAGMTSAQAKDLAEAIKNVDVSGNFTFEYKDVNRTDANDKASSQENEYDLEITTKVPVNDMVTAIVKVDSNDEETDDEGANSNKSLDIEDAYFSFNTGYATINVGQQNIPGPLTDGQQGTGIVALVPVADTGVTFAAGYFNNHTISASSYISAANAATALSITEAQATTLLDSLKDKSAYEVALLGSVGPVNAELWYADVEDTLDVVNAKLAGSFGPISAMIQHTVLEFDSNNKYVAAGVVSDEKNKETNLTVSGEMGIFGAHIDYAKTGKDNDWGVAIDRDSDASATYLLEQLEVVGMADASVWAIGVDADVTDQINLALDYADGDYKDGNDKVDVNEVLFTAKYQMSENFGIRALYSMYEEDNKVDNTEDIEQDKGAIELKYTF
jgi:hypothetical protein